MSSTLRSILLVLSLSTLVSSPMSTTASALGTPCWQAPVDGWVIEPFREPPCPWCAGNRGIEYGIDGTQPVRAAGGGVVTFAGQVAGTRYVVVQHSDGWKLTYGKLLGFSARRGDIVLSRSVIGTATNTFFLSLRVDDVYRDPAPYLGVPRGRPRLVPIDGSAARPAPPATWVCSG